MVLSTYESYRRFHLSMHAIASIYILKQSSTQNVAKLEGFNSARRLSCVPSLLIILVNSRNGAQTSFDLSASLSRNHSSIGKSLSNTPICPTDLT